MMKKQEIHSSTGKLGLIALAVFMLLIRFALPTHGQNKPTHTGMATMDNMDDKNPEVAHPFFTHMGMPEAVGVYSIRLGGLITSADGKRDGDFAFHFETGLTKFIGFHLRNDGIRDRQHSEAMFQFAAIRSEDGMSGFSPIIEFEFPTHSGGDQHINTLVGFSTALAGPKAAFNQIIHYDPRSDGFEGSASIVLKLGTLLFPVMEISGEAAPGEMPIMNLLGGLKFRMSENLLLGIALQVPVTTRKDFSWQLVFQPDIEWGKMK